MDRNELLATAISFFTATFFAVVIINLIVMMIMAWTNIKLRSI